MDRKTYKESKIENRREDGGFYRKDVKDCVVLSIKDLELALELAKALLEEEGCCDDCETVIFKNKSLDSARIIGSSQYFRLLSDGASKIMGITDDGELKEIEVSR